MGGPFLKEILAILKSLDIGISLCEILIVKRKYHCILVERTVHSQK